MALERILTVEEVFRLERKGKINLEDYNEKKKYYFKCNGTYYFWREKLELYVSSELVDKEEDIHYFISQNNP